MKPNLCWRHYRIAGHLFVYALGSGAYCEIVEDGCDFCALEALEARYAMERDVSMMEGSLQ